LVFSALGFLIGMVIKTHADIAKFQNFIITPMAFLCGTFFPIDKMPDIVKQIIFVLPLTQTTVALRGAGNLFVNAWLHPLILGFFLIVLFVFGVRRCMKAE